MPARLGGKPVLITWGMKDLGFRPSMIGRMRDAFSDVAVVELKGARHYIRENALAEIAEAITTRFE